MASVTAEGARVRQTSGAVWTKGRRDGEETGEKKVDGRLEEGVDAIMREEQILACCGARFLR